MSKKDKELDQNHTEKGSQLQSNQMEKAQGNQKSDVTEENK